MLCVLCVNETYAPQTMFWNELISVLVCED